MSEWFARKSVGRAFQPDARSEYLRKSIRLESLTYFPWRIVTMSRKRSGFTLVEMLVVIAIIGMLVAMLMPALQMAREAARRSSCTNNLRQMGTALHAFHTAQDRLPYRSYRGPTGQSFSVHSQLLPYLEMEAGQDLIDWNLASTDPANVAALNLYVPTFLCPSDTDELPLILGGRNNYFVSGGSQINNGAPGSSGDPMYTLPKPDGPFLANPVAITGVTTPVNAAVNFKDIKDGLSYTAMMSEKLLGDGSNGIATRASDTFKPGSYPNTPDEARNACLALEADKTNPQWKDLSKQGNSTVGVPWMATGHSATWYQHVLRPNEPSCMWPPGRISTTPSSFHSGGVKLLMCDSSVRFMEDQVELFVWRAIGTRNGRETLPKF